ncbi:phenylacetic acid degradation protein PaaD [Kordiimonas sediminis]|uniref:Phenylacetic acid degradation protein PaaD n=1 Tax=Kordiimonas sediminis TaxID=1735581 RepID=A0A919E4A5_9PROT|nr:hydroxyphenylacetyl-CoA thioesterase PaaI [Kordiimonas sediminis]GHF10972.1 phenylacetic acid degradation protein PaaD [Kordiimonas sediminis]
MTDTPTNCPIDLITSVWHDRGLEGLLGVTIDSIEDGKASVSMDLKPEHLNFAGTAHGGVLFSLADSAFALACNTRHNLNVASGCSIEFMRPAMPGDKLTATAQWVDTSGRSSIYDIVVTNQNNDTIVLFKGRSHQTSKSLSDLK